MKVLSATTLSFPPFHHYLPWEKIKLDTFWTNLMCNHLVNYFSKTKTYAVDTASLNRLPSLVLPEDEIIPRTVHYELISHPAMEFWKKSKWEKEGNLPK
jgi:hypothetical protein